MVCQAIPWSSADGRLCCLCAGPVHEACNGRPARSLVPPALDRATGRGRGRSTRPQGRPDTRLPGRARRALPGRLSRLSGQASRLGTTGGPAGPACLSSAIASGPLACLALVEIGHDPESGQARRGRRHCPFPCGKRGWRTPSLPRSLAPLPLSLFYELRPRPSLHGPWSRLVPPARPPAPTGPAAPGASSGLSAARLGGSRPPRRLGWTRGRLGEATSPRRNRRADSEIGPDSRALRTKRVPRRRPLRRLNSSSQGERGGEGDARQRMRPCRACPGLPQPRTSPVQAS